MIMKNISNRYIFRLCSRWPLFYCFIVSMKKYFLLIALFVIVVLWLGNYSFAVTCNDLWKDPNVYQNAVGACDCTWWYTSVSTSTGSVCKPCSDAWVCCGISLNTSIPFIGNCIENSATDRGDGELAVSWTTAFPVLMWSLTKILVTVILIVSFVLIIVGGIMISIGKAAEGRKMIINVIIGIALLGASGVILRLINPNFFG